jgi:hypothetical protein
MTKHKAPPHTFRVVLREGSEQQLGEDPGVQGGALIIRDGRGEVQTIYAPGEWRRCERLAE